MAPFCPSSAGSSLPMLLGQVSRVRRDSQAGACSFASACEMWTSGSNSARTHRCFFRFGVVCSEFLSLAECWRFASFPYSSWKDLRVFDRVAAELFSPHPAPPKLRLWRGAPWPRTIVIKPNEPLTHNNERLLRAGGFWLAPNSELLGLRLPSWSTMNFLKKQIQKKMVWLPAGCLVAAQVSPEQTPKRRQLCDSSSSRDERSDTRDARQREGPAKKKKSATCSLHSWNAEASLRKDSTHQCDCQRRSRT